MRSNPWLHNAISFSPKLSRSAYLSFLSFVYRAHVTGEGTSFTLRSAEGVAFLSVIATLKRHLSFLLQLCSAKLKHVCWDRVWIFKRRGAQYSFPSSPGVQGWRRRCFVLTSPVHHKPSWPNSGGLFLWMDSHSLGCAFWKGKLPL